MADVRVNGPAVERGEEILTPEALEFVADLQTRFGAHRDALLSATAEISRSQVWQWINAGVELDTGETVTAELVRRIIDEEVAGIGELDRVDDARRLFEQVALAEEYPDFLTLPAYELIEG